MKLITAEIVKKLAKKPLYSTDKEKVSDVVVKFFTPDSNWTWYVLEGRFCPELNDWEFFGLVEGFETELGYFTLSELKKCRGRLGLPIERDMYFTGRVDKTNNTIVK